jgi:hypothetical protein
VSKHAGPYGAPDVSGSDTSGAETLGAALGPRPAAPPPGIATPLPDDAPVNGANGVHASNGTNGANGSNGSNGHHGANGDHAHDVSTRRLSAVPPTVVESGAGREVTCPECGTVARVTVNRRESHDFCVNCDFPLFWTPSQVVRDDSDAAAHAALKRLPGTAGRQTIGSMACPVCNEANPINGVTCLRCHADLHPAAPAPKPEPVAPPPPVAAPAKPSIWPWVAVGVLTLALVIAVVLVLIYGE